MRLHQNPPYDDLSTIISTHDYQWRMQLKLTVLWTIPFTPNFLLYNKRRSKLLGFGNLSRLHEEEAQVDERQMASVLKVLASKLREKRVSFLELHATPSALTVDGDSDGVHLGRSSQTSVFEGVLRHAVSIHPLEAPKVVVHVKALEDRRHRKLRRRLSRRRRQAKKAIQRANLQRLTVSNDDPPELRPSGGECSRENVYP